MARKRKHQWDWRPHLTEAERAFIAASDNLRTAIEAMKANHQRTYALPRSQIINRCVQRAKKAARLPAAPEKVQVSTLKPQVEAAHG